MHKTKHFFDLAAPALSSHSSAFGDSNSHDPFPVSNHPKVSYSGLELGLRYLVRYKFEGKKIILI